MTDLREQIAQAFHEATKDNLVEFQSFETGYEAGWQAARATAEQSNDAINVAIALERVRALEIVSSVREQGFSKSDTSIPTQSESVFDLACEEIDHRLRNETWELNGVSAPETVVCSGQSLSIDQIVLDAKRFACYWAGRSRANRDEAEAEFRRALKSQQDAANESQQSGDGS